MMGPQNDSNPQPSREGVAVIAGASEVSMAQDAGTLQEAFDESIRQAKARKGIAWEPRREPAISSPIPYQARTPMPAETTTVQVPSARRRPHRQSTSDRVCLRCHRKKPLGTSFYRNRKSGSFKKICMDCERTAFMNRKSRSRVKARASAFLASNADVISAFNDRQRNQRPRPG